MGKLTSSITELEQNLVSARAKADQTDMEHRSMRVNLKAAIVRAMQEDDSQAMNSLIEMFMYGEQLRAENYSLISVSETYLELLKELEGYEQQ